MALRLAKLMDFAARYTTAWCSQDAASVAAFFAADGSLTINDNEPAVGRKAITESVQAFMSAFPDLWVAMDGVKWQSEFAEYNWTLTGTNTGHGGKGNRVRISGLEVWEFGEDGLIRSSKGRFDSGEYRKQLAL
jgi:nuclear transport factor 2 (NTF2) superfamily protein